MSDLDTNFPPQVSSSVVASYGRREWSSKSLHEFSLIIFGVCTDENLSICVGDNTKVYSGTYFIAVLIFCTISNICGEVLEDRRVVSEKKSVKIYHLASLMPMQNCISNLLFKAVLF